jgi:hypothetical protein
MSKEIGSALTLASGHRARCGVVNVFSGALCGYRYVRKVDDELARYVSSSRERRSCEKGSAGIPRRRRRSAPLRAGSRQRHPDASGQATVGAEQDLENAPQPGVSGNGLLSKDCDDAARARPEAPGGCASGAACRSIPPRYGIARAESGSRFPCRRWSPRFSTRWPTPGSPRIAASRRAAPRSRPLLQGSWSVDRAAGAGNPHAMFVRRTEASS